MRSGLILTLLERVNHKYKKVGHNYVGVCPSCKGGEKSACCSFDPKKNCWNCFSCGISGNLKDLAQLLDINFVSFLNSESVTLGADPLPVEKVEKKPLPKQNLNISDIATYCISNEVKDYLHSRHINPGVREVEQHISELKPVNKFYSGLCQSGFKLVIPMHGPNGECKSVKIRKISGGGDKKAVNLKGYSPICMGWKNLPEIKKTDRVLIVEGEIDFLSVMSSNVKNVLAIPSATYNFHEDELQSLPNNIFILLDNDQPGKENALRLAKQIYSARKPRRNVYVCSYPEQFKDANDCLTQLNGNYRETRDEFLDSMSKGVSNKYSPFSTSASVMNEMLGEIREKIELAEAAGLERPEVNTISTGIFDLDIILNGGIRSGLYGIAGRPGVGKTSMILALAKSILENNPDIYICLFSVEMTAKELVAQLLSWGSGISRYRILDNDLDKNGLERLEKAAKKLEKVYNRIILDDKARTVSQFKKTTIDLMNDTEKRCVVFIDYLQQIQSEERATDLRLTMKKISYELKDFANNYEIPVFVISSTQREQYKNASMNDLLSSFKESGDIEYSLYVGLYLEEIKDIKEGYRIKTDTGGRAVEKPIKITLIKNRHGSNRDCEGHYMDLEIALDFRNGHLRSLRESPLDDRSVSLR